MTLIDPIQVLAPREVKQLDARTLHLEWLDRLETAFEAVVLRSLKRAIRPVAQRFDALTATPGEPLVSADDLTQVRTLWAAQVADELLPLLGDVYMTGAQGVATALSGVATDVPDFVSVGAQEWIGVSQNRLNRVGDHAWLNAREQLLEGFQRGESIDELAKRVRQVIDVTAARAKTIARTEVIGASNAGAFAEAKAVGAETKTWLNTHDAKTRSSHVRAGEQTVAIDEPFEVGGHRLRFPHDPFAPPSETVNCRCTILFDDRPLCVCTPGWVKKEAGPLTAAAAPDCGCSSDRGKSVFAPKAFTTESGAYSAAQANRFGQDGWKSWRGSLSVNEKIALNRYSDRFHETVNAILRGRALPPRSQKLPRPQAQSVIKQMDKAFDRPSARTPEDALLYRGLQGELAEKLNKLFDQGQLTFKQDGELFGVQFTDRGFVSTSLSPTSAQRFARGSASQKVVMHIQAPAGTRAIYPGPDVLTALSDAKSELEVILPRNTRLQVIAAERDDKGVLQMTMRIIDGT